jgi:transcriptional regulator with XRE-family HTH domain
MRYIVSPNHIGRLERGEGGNSRPPTVRKLAEALGVEPTELIQGD